MFSKTYFPPNAFRVCVDDRGNDIIGRVYSPLSESEILFEGIEQLLLKMDKVFDEAGYPQAFQSKRSFEEQTPGNAYRGIPQALLQPEVIAAQKGRRNTFDFVVESRRNSSWQGYITVLETGERHVFQGDMDLLALLPE